MIVCTMIQDDPTAPSVILLGSPQITHDEHRLETALKAESVGVLEGCHDSMATREGLDKGILLN